MYTMQESHSASEIFQFTSEDLQANEQGRITERQRAAMKKRIRAKFWRDSVLFVIPASIVATPSIAICAVTVGAMSLSTNSSLLLVIVVVVWSLIYALALITLDRYLAALDDLRWGNMAAVSGRAIVGEADISFGRTFHPLTVGEQEFRLSASEIAVFRNDQPCRIYFLRHAGIILSVEFPQLD